MTPQDVLLQAADLIERTGWCQGHFRTLDDDGKPCAFCVLGAINQVAEVPRDAYWGARQRLRRFTGLDIADWNDAEGRTKDQVISTLRKAAQAEAK